MTSFEIVGLFLFQTGLIIGLGAVTVIDIHGFLGRYSHYWTEATVRTHKVTKPLIWIGTTLSIVGGVLLYSETGIHVFSIVHIALGIILIANGIFLSFWVSPFLLQRERSGMSSELLPAVWQHRILKSFIISFVGWWSTVVVLCWYIYTIL